jgi:methylated-DNA-[protein]-cysteine S-methyltransferase
MIRYALMPSPLGELLLEADAAGLTGVDMLDAPHVARPGARRDDDDPLLAAARSQLEAYFAGELVAFDLPLAAGGTPFQRRVWQLLVEIPFATTTSYGALARRLGRPGAMRAVGLANGKNPIGIIVPCHRVIGADGALTGYGGGLWRKRWLLAHEQAVMARRAGRLL